MGTSILTAEGGTFDLEDGDRASLAEIKRQANLEVERNFGRDDYREALAQQIINSIYVGFEHENFLSLMAEVENLALGERSYVQETRGLRAFWTALDGYIEVSNLQTDVFDITPQWVGFHVSDSVTKARANFANTQQTLVERGIERLDAEINKRALAVFQAAVDVGDPQYVSAAGLSLSALDSAIAEVRDASRQRQVTIFGRATMTDQIVSEIMGSGGNGAGFLPTTNEELLRTGQLGTYKGARIVTLTNFLDDTDTPFFPANELWVVAPDASKFALWGTLEGGEWVEQDSWYWHFHARKAFGGIVHRPDRTRRIIDSTITP